MSKYGNSSLGLRQKSSADLMAENVPNHYRDDVVIEVGKETKTVQHHGPDKVQLLCFDISNLSTVSQFLLLSGATFFFYLIYGYMQELIFRLDGFQPFGWFLTLVQFACYTELIFRLDGFQPFGWFLTLVQFACYTVFGILELQLKEDKTRKIPLRTYSLLAFLTVATMGLSNTSVGYLNYPTQVIFKCCKLIPVMIGGVFIQGKRYKPVDVCAVLCMCSGLIMFTLADSTVYPKFNTYGVILISLALCADGAIGNVQEKALKQYASSNSEMVLYSYSIGFLYILVGLLVTGGLLPAFEFFNAHPVETYGYAVIFSITGYIGVNIVLTLVKTFGALVAVTVTTGRKAITIILSFIFFAKPFSFQYIWSGCVVVSGIYLNVYSKNQSAFDDKFHRIWRRILHTVGIRRIYDYSDIQTTV